MKKTTNSPPIPPWEKLIKKVKPTIICIQETKCANKNLGCLNIKGFETYWNCADKAGYSGVSIWSREKPLNLEYNLPYLNDESKSLLTEGRIITAHFKDFVLVNYIHSQYPKSRHKT